jgi:uncharacterized phage-associated protein
MIVSIASVHGDIMTGLFKETKATQAAARFLTLRGGRMSCIKLVKLLYLADREALLRWGLPITSDRFVSLDIGPVVGWICELVQGEPAPNSARIWRKFISDPDHYEVHLLADPGSGELGAQELSLIEEIFEQHGRHDRWSLVEYTRALPEWTYPNGSALPIEYRDILKSAGKTESEISRIEEALESAALAERVLV